MYIALLQIIWIFQLASSAINRNIAKEIPRFDEALIFLMNAEG